MTDKQIFKKGLFKLVFIRVLVIVYKFFNCFFSYRRNI